MKKKVKKVENRGIDSAELILALEELEKEKGIKKDYVLESIETALVTAYKRNFDVNSENVKVTMNPETGETHVYEELDVVEEVEDPATQISLEDAKKIDVKYKAGDVVEKELMPKNFGRIAAQTAKQVIVQRIREASRDVIFNEFTEKKGEIISGIVQKVDKSIVVIDLGKIEGIMPLKEQIPTENYYVNQKLRACVADVEKGPKGSTQIGLIEIKSISRDPGKRCKVAVYSQNENIDPVGSCVGQKGIRIQNIINELCGEKIDVIEWNEDPSIFIAEALLPAKVMAVDIKEEEKFAQVIVPDDQLSLAIGKSGQNARLAAKLTNWKIDIKSKSQFQEMLAQLQEENPEAEENEEVNEVVEEVQEEKPKAKRTRKTTKKEVE